MSDILQEAVGVLNEKLSGGGFDGSAKFEITDLGAIVMDASGARLSDDAADVTLTADADTFKGILEGDLNPTSAFMTGKLSVDGDMGLAMQLASVLA
ncbi:MAG: SCP2 sterol-binding domain-containing protein [Pseudomonadota bacterium]